MHAGKNVDKKDADRLRVPIGVTGAFVGTVEVVGMVEFNPENWATLYEKHLTAGALSSEHRFGWVLERPVRFRTAVIGNGRLGIFSPPEQVQRQILSL